MEWFGPSTSVNLHEVDASLGVSYTPALLKCIFRQLTNPQDRNSVELSCQRFCTASRATPWKSDGELKILFPVGSYDEVVYVKLGEVTLTGKCLTRKSRMQSRARKTPRNLQPPILLEKLDQLGNRFQMIEVRKVLIGNLNTERTHIPSDNTMVVTKDLMQFVTSNCYGVRTLVFQNCIVDEDSLKFMASEEFTIKNRLKEVVLDNIRYDDDESVKNFSNLITHETRCLSFNQCSISFMESVVLEKLRSLNHRVDLVNIGFDENESDPKREIFIEEFKQYSKLVIPMGSTQFSL